MQIFCDGFSFVLIGHFLATSNHNIALAIFQTVQQNKINLGLYLILFHHGEPLKNTGNAIDFFVKMACLYNTCPHMTYPIQNVVQLVETIKQDNFLWWTHVVNHPLGIGPTR